MVSENICLYGSDIDVKNRTRDMSQLCSYQCKSTNVGCMTNAECEQKMSLSDPIRYLYDPRSYTCSLLRAARNTSVEAPQCVLDGPDHVVLNGDVYKPFPLNYTDGGYSDICINQYDCDTLQATVDEDLCCAAIVVNNGTSNYQFPTCMPKSHEDKNQTVNGITIGMKCYSGASLLSFATMMLAAFVSAVNMF